MDKRYQIFISSTYADLQDERKEVIQALLELNCIPAGMELFPAANEDQWTLIKSVIDDCDYYIVIIGGRYGSESADGISYTQKEYEYAVEVGKPVLAFLHRKPLDISVKNSDGDADKAKKLSAFKDLVSKRHVKFWESPYELGSVVSRSVIAVMKSHPATGWIKSDQLNSVSMSKIAAMKARIEDLEEELLKSSTEGPKGTEYLAQGDDNLEIAYKAQVVVVNSIYNVSHSMTATWNDVFATISPRMLNEATENTIRDTIADMIEKRERRKWWAFVDEDGDGVTAVRGCEIDQSTFDTIIIQLRALGLIQMSTKAKSVKDSHTRWMLTAFGDTVLNRLRAIRR